MNIGDIVTVSGETLSLRRGHQRVVERIDTEPRKALYLGKTILYKGEVIFGDNEGDPNWLRVTGIVRVLVFQPLHKTGQRYRKPFYAMVEDVVIT